MEIIDRINAALKLTSAVVDIAKSGDLMAAITTLKETIQSLREELLTVKEQVSALTEEKAALEQRLGEMERFDLEKTRYTRKRLDSGSEVYVAKEIAHIDGEPQTYFCARCFGNRKQSTLEFVKRDFHHDTYTCPVCQSTAFVPNGVEMEAITAPIRRSFHDGIEDLDDD